MIPKLTKITVCIVGLVVLISCSQFADDINGTWEASKFILEGQKVLPGVIDETLLTFFDYRKDVGQVLIEITYTDGRMVVFEGEYVFTEEGESIEVEVATTVPEVGETDPWSFDKIISGDAMILDGTGLGDRPLAFELRKSQGKKKEAASVETASEKGGDGGSRTHVRNKWLPGLLHA